MFKLQLEMPTKGDWVSTCFKDLKELEITLEDIKNMTKYRISKLLRQKANTRALKYLTEKQGVKGKEINYSKIEMAEYLSPSNNKLTIDEKRKLFEIRNKMVNIPANFPKYKTAEKCMCGENENMEHLYTCKYLNKEKSEISYQQIYTTNMNNQIAIFRKTEKVLENREQRHKICIHYCENIDGRNKLIDQLQLL